MDLGPVYEAAHGGRVNPWFPISIGTLVLVFLWAKYFRGELRKGTPFGTLMGITAICLIFITLGIWELFK